MRCLLNQCEHDSLEAIWVAGLGREQEGTMSATSVKSSCIMNWNYPQWDIKLLEPTVPFTYLSYQDFTVYARLSLMLSGLFSLSPTHTRNSVHVMLLAAAECASHFVQQKWRKLSLAGAAAVILHAAFRNPNLKIRMASAREDFRAVWWVKSPSQRWLRHPAVQGLMYAFSEPSQLCFSIECASKIVPLEMSS